MSCSALPLADTELLLSIMSVCSCLFVPYFPYLCYLLDREWVHLTCLASFSVLTWPSLCTWQRVSAPWYAWSFLVSWLDPPCILNRKWVPLVCLVSFSVLTRPSLCTWQEVSAPCMLGFFQCSDLTLSVNLTGSQCHLCTWFLYILTWPLPICLTVCECLLHCWVLLVS
jgi:hypothetical protein